MTSGDHNTIYNIITKNSALRRYAYDFTSLMEEKTRDFVGRGFVFEKIEEVVRGHPCAYLRIVAEAGMGKTAMASAIVQRYQAETHFFGAGMGATLVFASDPFRAGKFSAYSWKAGPLLIVDRCHGTMTSLESVVWLVFLSQSPYT